MAPYVCRHCGARNTNAGRCIMCRRSMGSLAVGLLAAFVSTLVLGANWITWSLITGTGFHFALYAVAFGAIVSGITMRISCGRGPLYQLIATSATVLGIFTANTVAFVALYALSIDAGIIGCFKLGWQDWVDAFRNVVLYDALTNLWAFLGILGGFFIWRP